ncbi:hypothetical protein PspLS_03025 [Pyricularia sp. CBS 133598]|nr:hypothetical protein PspLS_03025 [Pyricularia sp. CBS 133598]
MVSNQSDEKPQQSGKMLERPLTRGASRIDEEVALLCSDIRGQLVRMVAMIGKDKASAIGVPIPRPVNHKLEKRGKLTSEPETSKKP